MCKPALDITSPTDRLAGARATGYTELVGLPGMRRPQSYALNPSERRHHMKKLAGEMAIVIVAITFLITGCSDDSTTLVAPEELNPPLGLVSVTGNGEVDLAWYTSNFESDLNGYCIYVYEGTSTDLSPRSSIPAVFDSVGCVPVGTPSSELVEATVTNLENGETYSFLVVAAMDNWTRKSYTSNIVIDTPRPDVAGLVLKNQNLGQGDCALKFSATSPYVEVVDETDPGAAIMFESFDAGLGKRSGFVGVQGRAQVQDLGYMSNWDAADEAPTQGYPASDFSVTAIERHVYAVRTVTPNYAKIYVSNISGDPADNSDEVTIWVAYQPDTGNPELMPPLH
jgi:hypothetical protein